GSRPHPSAAHSGPSTSLTLSSSSSVTSMRTAMPSPTRLTAPMGCGPLPSPDRFLPRPAARRGTAPTLNTVVYIPRNRKYETRTIVLYPGKGPGDPFAAGPPTGYRPAPRPSEGEERPMEDGLTCDDV